METKVREKRSRKPRTACNGRVHYLKCKCIGDDVSADGAISLLRPFATLWPPEGGGEKVICGQASGVKVVGGRVGSARFFGDCGGFCVAKGNPRGQVTGGGSSRNQRRPRRAEPAPAPDPNERDVSPPLPEQLRSDLRSLVASLSGAFETHEVCGKRAIKAEALNARRIDDPGCYCRACSTAGALDGWFLAGVNH